MWILPKQLHTSAYVPDTAALISDLDEQSQICEQSLLARSKPSLARTWSQRWKRDSWTQHLSGRILKPSHGQTFVTAWTSSLEVIPVSHLVQQASDSEQKIHDTYGHLSQPELFPCDPESASLRTSRDTSASDSERSLANWKALVIRLRGEYSLRVKSAHLTNASECLSWPTIRASEYKDTGPIGSKSHDHMLGKGYLCAVVTQEAANWPTPCAMEAEKAGLFNKGQMGQSLSAMANRGELGLPAPVNPSTDGNRQESWGTPSCMDTLPARSAEALARAKLKGGCKNLREEVHQWATPNTMDCLPSRSYEAMKRQATVGERKNRSKPGNLREQIDPLMCQAYKDAQAEANQWATPRTGATDNSRPNNKGGIPLGDQARRAEAWGTPRCSMAQDKQEDSGKHRLGEQIQHGTTGKLNPRWVETLMGLPIGWTMPSCSSPLTIAPTNCDCSEMESCRQQQKELF